MGGGTGSTKKKKNWNYIKNGSKLATAFLLVAYLTNGVFDGIWTPKQYIKESKDKKQKNKLEKSLKQKIFENPKNATHVEQFKLYKLMEIQDSSSTYFPSLKDWKKAYQNYYLQLNPLE